VSVATIDEIMSRVQAAGQKVGEAIQLLQAAEHAAAEVQQQMAAVGVVDKAAMFGQIRDGINRTQQHLVGGNESANQVIAQTRAAGG
jgi:hypothetical protein